MDIFSVITLLGGLTFFLFGMDIMSKNLEKLAGGKLELLLKKMTAKPIIGLLLGTVITCVIQSSSAVTVMLVGLVNSGIMQFSQTIAPIFGANIGTTITAWILSLSGIESDAMLMRFLKPAVFSLILAFIGIIFNMFSKKDKLQTIGNIFIGFAVLIFGMELMSDATEPLTTMPEFESFVGALKNPIVALVAAAIFTGIIQSSSASVGILQVLSQSGAISYTMAVPIIMGQNIGTCVTAMISSIGANTKARRVAVVHLTINLTGTLILLPLYFLGDWLFKFPFSSLPIDAFGIAILHTFFNVLVTAMLMPFSKWLIKVAEKLAPEKTEEKTDSIMVVDDRLFRSPSVAVLECGNATVEMAKLSRQALSEAMSLFDNYDEKVMNNVLKLEDNIDRYEDRLGSYLVKVSTLSLSQEDSREISKMLHAIGDFERLGDHALNLAKAAKEINEKGISFSERAQGEIAVLRRAVNRIVQNTTFSYETDDIDVAVKVEPLEQVVDKLIAQIRTRHIDRLQKGECTIELGFILSDVLTNYERISDHCSNIAVAIIEARHDSFDAHKYLNDVKHDNAEFDRAYREYSEKYAL